MVNLENTQETPKPSIISSNSYNPGYRPQDNRLFITGIILMFIILIVTFSIIFYNNLEELEIAECNSENECGVYNIFSFGGEGYICINDEKVEKGGFKTRLIMAKYSNKNSVVNEPSSCSCISNYCEPE
ncbi:MAG: hypothetical protein WDZ62_01440 [Candidatus Pacearchaeota archaeon]